MRVIRTAGAALLAVNFLIGQGSAETLAPAEAPPADFAGNQYVDSAGCVFMRGEIGNRVTWLPRLNRDRQQVCGYAPSYPAGALPVDAAEPEPVVEPMVATAAGTGAAEPAVAPAPKIAPTSNTRHKTPVERAAALTCPCFVQVGAFAVFSNADRVAERLLDMGFRVTIVRERLGRRPIRTVLAGPFDEAAAYIDAFNRVRDAGFADAFRRRQPVHMP